MFLPGTAFITSDLDVVRNLSVNHKTIVLGETPPVGVPPEMVIPATILLPPYEALEAEMDNNIEKYVQIYTMHLSTREATEFITVLILALMKGTNILLYITKDESELAYSKFLLAYMLNNYGISIGTQSSPFSYFNNEIADWTIVTHLYEFDLISVQEYFNLHPANMQISDNIILKLVNELNPYVEDSNFESYRMYFNEYKNRIKSAGIFLTNPISISKG